MKKAITIFCTAIVAALCVGLFAGCKPPEVDWWDQDEKVTIVFSDERAITPEIICGKYDYFPSMYYKYNSDDISCVPNAVIKFNDDIMAEGEVTGRDIKYPDGTWHVAGAIRGVGEYRLQYTFNWTDNPAKFFNKSIYVIIIE